MAVEFANTTSDSFPSVRVSRWEDWKTFTEGLDETGKQLVVDCALLPDSEKKILPRFYKGSGYYDLAIFLTSLDAETIEVAISTRPEFDFTPEDYSRYRLPDNFEDYYPKNGGSSEETLRNNKLVTEALRESRLISPERRKKRAVIAWQRAQDTLALMELIDSKDEDLLEDIKTDMQVAWVYYKSLDFGKE